MIKKDFTRRVFLQGSTGGLLAMPFLPSLFENAYGAGAIPPRVLFIMGLVGQRRYQFFPLSMSDNEDVNEATTDATLLTDTATKTRYIRLSDLPPGNISPIFDSKYDAYRNDMSILRGLDMPAVGGHQTHSPMTGCNEGGDAASQRIPSIPWSMDNILAKASSFYKTKPYMDVIRVSDGGGWTYSWKEVSGRAYPLVGFTKTEALFDSLFGSLAGTSPLKNKATDLIVDKVLEDRNNLLKNPRLSANDKIRIEQYFDQLRDIQTRMKMDFSSCTAPSLGPEDDEIVKSFKNYIDMIVIAFQCGMSQLGLINFKHTMPTYSASNANHSNYHANSHNSAYPVAVAARAEKLIYEQFIAETTFFYAMKKMKEITESNGKTMLDNSLIYFGKEMGDGGHHHSYSMPVVTAGSLQGKIKSGHFVDYRQRPFIYKASRKEFGSCGILYQQFMVTLMQAAGLSPFEYRTKPNLDKGGFGDYVKRPTHYNSEEIWGKLYDQDRDAPLPFWYNKA